MQRTLKLGVTLGVASLSAVLFAQSTVVVYSQNTAPGDSFTSANAFPNYAGSSFGNANWVYNNVLSNGQVGIRTTYARSGNGSVFFRTPNGNAKADIEYFDSPFLWGGYYRPSFNPWFNPPPTLSQLTHLRYDWYRDSNSTVHGWYHPSIRVFLVAPSLMQSGYLVFERYYNNLPTPTDTWVTDDIIANDYYVWSTHEPAATRRYNVRFSDWKAPNELGNWFVVGICAGVGSGWFGPNGNEFIGAVDNITFGFNGRYTTYNFEVVPEPASMLALGSGLVSLLALRRRRK